MTFEALECWQQARQPELARDFGLCGQIQRAEISIMSNTAEGFERKHVPEKLQFYNIARGSGAEVRSLLYVIGDNYPASAMISAQLRATTIGVSKLVTGLIRSTEKRRT